MAPRFQTRSKKVVTPVASLTVAAAAATLLGLQELPSWLAWCPPWLAQVLAASLVGGTTWGLVPWASRRQAALEQEQRPLDLLRRHLGRDGLPLIGELGADGLALRVHVPVPLPTPPPSAASAPSTTQGTRPPEEHRLSTSIRPDDELPAFVERDVSDRVRTWMRVAREHGGFLLIVGNSAVGKTRILYESARQELADFYVLAPDLGNGGLVNLFADATSPIDKVIVWLDELQRFLPGPYFAPNEEAEHTPITVTAIRKLLSSKSTIVIVATLWPEYVAELRAFEYSTAPPTPRHPAAVDILSKNVTNILLETFSDTERNAAKALARNDSRLAKAVSDPNFNVSEALAGAPEIIRRYEQATAPQKAVIDSAIDAGRLGIRSPLTVALLRTAARGYLTTVESEDEWFDKALTEVSSGTRREASATAPLLAIPTPDHRGIRGYMVTDYLQQEIGQRRRSERLSTITWHALIEHTHDRDDRRRLGQSAEARMLYATAEMLLDTVNTTAASAEVTDTFSLDADDPQVIASFLEEQGTIDDLRIEAATGNPYAASALAKLLVARGSVDEAINELLPFADAGDTYATGKLVELLARQGRIDELQARTSSGSVTAAIALAELLAKQEQSNEAITTLQPFADAGDTEASNMLAELLAEQGLVDDLRNRSRAGDVYTTHILAELLKENGNIDEAIDVLRQVANSTLTDRDAWIVWKFDYLLADYERTDELRARADAGDASAGRILAKLLERQGCIAELRKEVHAGTPGAASVLVNWLVTHEARDYQELLTRDFDG